ncbi:MAG: polysaccharide pyruvyl transferase family protein [Clostridiales bacterium]|nr:polysaccharide pyruvyl transferase family protein [Clostridiales bacterium]
MEIQLNGYYDKNLGDDIMQRIIVRAFPQHTFYVKPIQREMAAHLENEPNVKYGTCDEVMINVIGTGFLFNSRMAKLSRLLSKPKMKYRHCAVVDCSIELVNDRLSALFTRDALMQYDHVSCRDGYSYDFIRKYTKKNNVFCYPDIVFSENVPKSFGDCLGIAPVRRMYGDVNYSYYKKLASAADSFVERYDRKVLLFAFDNGIENDISACGSIKNMMKYGDSAEIVIYNSDIDYFYSRIAECAKMIVSRFHAAVLALLCEIPIICVSDTNKVRDLCGVFGMTYLGRDDNSRAVFDFIVNNDEAVKIPDRIKEEAKKHISSLNRWLEEIK